MPVKNNAARTNSRAKNSHQQRGQILLELLSMVAFFIAFLALSTLLFDDYKKTSYRYMITSQSEQPPESSP